MFNFFTKKRFIIVIIIILFAAGGVFWWQNKGKIDRERKEKNPNEIGSSKKPDKTSHSINLEKPPFIKD